MKFAILDYGKNMASIAKALEKELKAQDVHFVIYLSDADGLLCLEEISEDEFLDHFKNTNKNGKA